jgi:hypothetical protein
MKDDRCWLDQIVTSSQFDDFEGEALEILDRQKESAFCVQYFRDSDPKFGYFVSGDKGSAPRIIPHGSEKLVHVHYHPNGSVSPAGKDVYGNDNDAAILMNDLEVPPVYMIGAVVDGSPIYLATQREGFPGRAERFLLNHTKPEKWRPISRLRNRTERARLLYENLETRLGEDIARELRGKPMEEVLGASELTHTDIARMDARALEYSHWYRTALLGVADSSPKVRPISDRRAWVYGIGEIFGQ